ncbi:S-acyl fatty acid synthase thioesterase, medium chain isoform X2 [Ochotona curzoniae]|uniref:S-acyl fatty acid synthase thioesterase, medium chain isoform X2 n=1 Tax=Ochotona curzoniae TaxID=130825 RepID=UPI001B35047C|nr:S-acyl fatty acid synthase thioesterase, medium chain isoform X2 [Ochotona curzoniae]
MEGRDQAGRTRNEKVLNCIYQNPNAIFKLICFPWAGGGSTYFAKWGQKIHNSLEVHAVRLAGRESRFEEPFADNMCQIVDEIVCALLPVIQDKPFAFFGHSMGSYIAFMTALHLKENHKLEPVHFFVSSATPPHSKERLPVPPDNELSEELLNRHLMDFGGTPQDFVDDKEFQQQYVPILLADVHILRNFIFETPSKAIFSCDFTCFLGTDDIAKDMEAWKDVTSGSLDVHVLPGNHFYLKELDNENFIKNYIAKCLELSSLANF